MSIFSKWLRKGERYVKKGKRGLEDDLRAVLNELPREPLELAALLAGESLPALFQRLLEDKLREAK